MSTRDFEISENASIKSKMEFDKKLSKLVDSKSRVLRITGSLCPDCVEEGKIKESKIDAVIYEKDGKVWMVKECPEHGIINDLYWGDYDMYKKASKWLDPGLEIRNPQIKKALNKISCPDDCGLCYLHKSHTGLGNIVVTNRCNLSCWYCFFYAKKGEAVYEPSLEQIRSMLRNMKNQKPIGTNAVQLTGGEPSLRKDIIDIVKIARREGYDHIQFNTNGIRLSKDQKFVRDLRKANVTVIYMSFDGVTPETNPKNYWEFPSALNNCKKVGQQVVLVPTVIGGVNDHELGDIITLAAGNIDLIRSVNFQPVSLVGSMPHNQRMKWRITCPDVCKKIEEQTDGQIGREDFFTIPVSTAITRFIEELTDQFKYRLSTHFACGLATYVFVDGNQLIPISRFMDVEGFFDCLNKLREKLQESKVKKIKKATSSLRLLWNIRKLIDNSKKPDGLDIDKIITSALIEGNYNALREFHYKSLFIGMMHFMDLYNYDIDRVQRCCIHYATPDGRIIPFCAFNVIPQVFRDKTQKEFSTPAEEWEKKHKRKLKDDKYKRKLTERKKRKVKEFYDKFKVKK